MDAAARIAPCRWPTRSRTVQASQSVGRSSKVGKEELAGFLAAIELYLAEDEGARFGRWESQVTDLVGGLAGLPGVVVRRVCPGVDPVRPAVIPRVHLDLPGHGAERLAAALWRGDPPVGVTIWRGSVVINPHMLGQGEEAEVVAAVRRALAATGG